MKWNSFNVCLPDDIEDWYLNTHDCSGQTSVVIFGYDVYNCSPRYEIVFINDAARVKPQDDGRYIINKLVVTHWLKLERPV